MPAWLNDLSERSGGFMPHGHCYLWIPSLLWMHVVSNALIGTAYLGISLILYLLVRSIRLPFSPVFIAFGLFIGLCGITHSMGIWTVWHPDYFLDGLIKAATAAALVATAIGLLYVRPQVMQTVEAARLSEERRVQLEAAHAELEGLYRKVTELDELKTQFFANVSHELRTPIATMDMNVQMFERSRETGLPAYQWGRVERLGRATRQIAALVESLLDYARVERGKVSVHPQELDAAAIVREVVAAHADHAAQGVALKFTTRGSVRVTSSSTAAAC